MRLIYLFGNPLFNYACIALLRFMQILEVNTATLSREFLLVHVNCHAGIPEWIQPLNKDISEVFDANKNKAFLQGEVIRWILKENNGRLIGRIAAFINRKYINKGDAFPVGGIGFFDCINNHDAANYLFDTVKNWLEKKGMQAMDGPINFGERDKWWGLLVKGFHAPLYGMNYNPPYYQQLFETYGFQIFYSQICWIYR